ncbi:hypothetical protein MBH78_02390 [Oceanimonas sp. NS1]|nr:hypothetical protein [Oceanimonas sp. NS1]
MLTELAEGRAVLGYNLLGSYVAAAVDKHPQLAAVAPRDYSLLLMRLALISRYARQPQLAGELLDFMLSPSARRRWPTVAAAAVYPEAGLTVRPEGPVTPIPLTPALLPALDPSTSRVLYAPGPAPWRPEPLHHAGRLPCIGAAHLSRRNINN